MECPAKKRRLNVQKFKPEYKMLWPCLEKSRKGEQYVFCSVCNLDFGCYHGGRNDCKRHIECKAHQDLAKIKAGSSLKNFFAAKQTSGEAEHRRNVTKAEAKMCDMIATLNLPLASADALCKTMKSMFPDSKIAKDMRCCRNKATAIIKEMSAIQMTGLSERMRQYPFSIATDGSNDVDKKQFPLVVRIYHPDLDNVNSELLSIPVCDGPATGENIFKLLEAEFAAQDVPWENCVAFGSDNASVMTGQHKGVISFVRGKNSNIFLAGCCLHLVHIAARKGAECLPPVEDILVDIFHFFKKSVNRQNNLRDLQQLFDVQQRKMLKHVSTRWLSIGRCLDRLLANWEPLKQLFAEEKDRKEKSSYSTKKVEEIFNFLRSPTNKLFCLFLAYTVKVFDSVLVRLQAEEPMIHTVKDSLERLIKDIFCRFVRPSALANKPVKDVECSVPSNQKEDSELMIGSAARRFLEDSNSHLRESRIKDFFKGVRAYFVAVANYMLSKLPLHDPVLDHIRIVDVGTRLEAKGESLSFLLRRFPCLKFGATEDSLLELFAGYQCLDVKKCLRPGADSTWASIAKEFPAYKPLAQVMLGLLTVPHSSAACERIFSCVRKNSTESRSSLGQDTLEALLVLKSCPGEESDFSPENLDRLKGAYYSSLQK